MEKAGTFAKKKQEGLKFASLSPCFFVPTLSPAPSLYNRGLVYSFASLVKRGGDSTPLLHRPSTKNQHRVSFHGFFLPSRSPTTSRTRVPCV